jgi:hypothetical protein
VPPPLPNYDYDRKYDGLTQRLYSVPSRQVGNGVRVGVDVGVCVCVCVCMCMRAVYVFVYVNGCACISGWVCVRRLRTFFRGLYSDSQV